jgi:hypothetical protein
MLIKFQNYKFFSDLIKEEISLGNTKSYDIDKSLYKSGDYICSQFKIDDRMVIVSSILIPNEDIKIIKNNRNYNGFSDFTKQFDIFSDSFLYIGFDEYKDGKYFNSNVNDTKTLFRKMTTIIDIIKTFIDYYNKNVIIFKSNYNDPNSGLTKDYNKRDKFYNLFLTHHNIKTYEIKNEFDINGEIISNFFLFEYKNI